LGPVCSLKMDCYQSIFGGKEGDRIVIARRARLYDAIALLIVIIIIAVDQWTKNLVVEYLSPPQGKMIPLIDPYLMLFYIQNKGAAFGMFDDGSHTIILTILIGLAVVVVGYLYSRIINTGPLIYKIVFGMIIGGALGNLIDRARHTGYVVDFVFFRIPQIGFNFAIFNVADACISVGVVLLFLLMLFGGMGRGEAVEKDVSEAQTPGKTAEVLHPTE
jgi:signal peptidase II